MKKTFIALLMAGTILSSCNNESKTSNSQDNNPFFAKYATPHGTIPFSKITFEHYKPAFIAGIKAKRTEIDAIVNNTEKPSFSNTIEAMENSGSLLSKVSSVFYNISSSNTNDQIKALAKELSPMLSALSADVSMNKALFAKVKSVFDNKSEYNLSIEEAKLLENTYKSFVKGGANLNEDSQEKLRLINSKLSSLSINFGENVLNDSNSFELVISKKEDLSGLPESVIAAAAATAKDKNKTGKWVFTLDKPSLLPFLQYADNSTLRREIYQAYINRGNNNNKNDNKKIVSEIVNLRVEKAKLFGFNNYAELILENNMAKTPEKAINLLSKLWKSALPNAKKELAEMQKLAKKSDPKYKLNGADWWYYAEKVKKAKYDLDESELRPYFSIDNVRDGAFLLATKLYGIKFIERNDIEKYHADVQTWELQESDGTHIGIFYLDYFPRESKRSGAWMNSFRKQSGEGTDNFISPIICNVCNFTKPVGDSPALLSVDEVETLFHEFGHALHGFLSKCKYNSISGTSVSRDFVELPSQVMENWSMEPEMLALYAKHYKTGKTIPAALVTKVQNASKFNQGFSTVEYLAAALLDLKYHSVNTVKDINTKQFEGDYLKSMGLIPEIVSRYRSTNFNHIFSGGYSAGYYAYIWAGVLDSDAFQAFKDTSLFDKATATAFRKNILEKGGTEDPMVLYKRFRGAEPSIKALLNKRGLN